MCCTQGYLTKMSAGGRSCEPSRLNKWLRVFGVFSFSLQRIPVWDHVKACEGLRWNVVLFSYSSGGSLCGADPITISGQTATPETPSKDSEILVHKSRHLSLFHLGDTFSIRPVNVSSVYMISIRIHSQILSKGDWFSDLIFQFKFQDPSEFLALSLPPPRSLQVNVLCEVLNCVY